MMVSCPRIINIEWIKIFVFILFSGIVFGKKCSIDSIKSGFSLRNGLETSNIKLVGDGLELEGCKRLCCRSETFQFGLFDGNKCFGIQCFGNNDSRCTLIEDGNAIYTIFSLNKDQLISKEKGTKKALKNKATAKIDKNIKESKHLHHQPTNKNSKKRKNVHRKHKRKKNTSKKQSRNRQARDYPYEYFQTPLWKLTNKRTNFNIQSLTKSPRSQNQYYKLLTNQYAMNEPLRKYNSIQNFPNMQMYANSYTQYPMLNNYQSQYYGRLYRPNTIANKNLINPSVNHNQLVRGLAMKNSSLPKYQTKFDIMANTQKKNFSPVHVKPIVMEIHEIVKKENIPLVPKTDEILTKKTMNLTNPIEIKKEKDEIMSEIDVKPLAEFSTDTDMSHSTVEKDAIPRPDDFETMRPTIAPRDGIDDVPFTSSIEPLKTTRGFLSGCLNPVGVSHSRSVPDDNMSASSFMDGFPPHNGRLKVAYEDDGGSWCASSKSVEEGKQQYLSIDFGRQTMFCRLGIQGYSRGKKWVDNFKIEFSDDGSYWEPYNESGKVKLFYGNHDEKDVTFQTLKNPIMSRFIKFVPIRWTGDVPCFRVEVFNTSLSKDNNHYARSDIPRARSRLLEDISFEKMDEIIALDRSTYGNNGLLYGGSKVIDTHSSCRHGVEIPLGGDIVFDGSVMKNHPRDAITIASWVKLNSIEGAHSIFDTVGSHSTHSLGQFHFEVVGGDVRWFHRNETGDEVFNSITGKLIKPNVWNHLAVTYDSKSGDAIIYINGTESAKSKGHGLLSSDWNNRAGIGRHKGSRFLDGSVDEFKLYDEALQKEAIEDLYKKCDFTRYYCGSTLTNNTGTIVSPGYPATFNGPVDCKWNIHGQPGEIIVMDMSQFKLGDKNTCGKANLEIRDGINNTVLGTFCGSALTPKKVLSHSNSMYIHYTTDGALPGENFKIEYFREEKRTAKKTLSDDCSSTKTMNNVTLIGGTKAGKFKQLGSTPDMDVCKSRCCHSGECDVAFLIGNNCYSVKCTNKHLCGVRRAKPSNLNPRLAFMSSHPGEVLVEPTIDELPVSSTSTPQLKAISTSATTPANSLSTKCAHHPILSNVTLTGGIKSGKFTSHGHVEHMSECIKFCCDRNDCDLAFMVKDTCFSLRCANDRLCRSKPAKPSAFHPMVAYMTRYKPQISKTETGIAKGEISSETEESKCKDMRVSKVYRDVTLAGGINSGDFTDKGHVSDIDECVSKCCDTDTCNVAFVIKDTCFLVKCKSYKDCGLKSAISEYYSPKIAYINWSPPKELDTNVPYSYRGCWRDFDITAFAMPLMEGTDAKLSEPYKKRSDPINTCSRVAQDRGYKVFAIQNGGACFSGPDADQTFKRYGKSEACKNGKGGPFANSVYKTFEDGSVISLGCWADLKDRAFRRMEKNDPELHDNFLQRSDPIGACAKVAEKMKVPFFALQKGGQCFVGKSDNIEYDRYSPSRKCKYGLGGQMANDVYRLKRNFTSEVNIVMNKTAADNVSKIESSSELPKQLFSEAPTSINEKQVENSTTTVSNTSELVSNMTTSTTSTSSAIQGDTKKFDNDDDVHLGENVYKEDIQGNDVVKYIYRASDPLSNVTLKSAINAGKFEDKGKVDSINDCIKICGQNQGCDVAFMLSSQCFTVHCNSEESCQTKPAYSNFYKPQIAFIKHRSIKKLKNDTATRTSLPTTPSTCKVKTELSNVTFIEGINSGNFTDLGHVLNFGECKQKCCDDARCNIAFKIQDDCYGVACHSRESCRTRPAKNANVFNPEMALMRMVKESIGEVSNNHVADNQKNVLTISTPKSSFNDISSENPVKKHESPTANATSKSQERSASNSTAISSNYQCLHSEWDNKVIFNQTLVGGINAGDFREHGQTESMKECMNYCCSEKDCDLSFMIDRDCYTVKCFNSNLCKTRQAKTTSFIPRIAFKKKSNIIGTVSSLSHTTLASLKNSTVNGRGLATPVIAEPKKHSCDSGKIIYNATLRLGMHSGMFTKLGRVSNMDDCIERCCRSSNADVAYKLGSFCFAVKCKTRDMCKPSPTMFSDITSLNLNPAISFLNEDKIPLSVTGDSRSSSKSNDGTCSDSPITYNVTLRGGVHAGKFTQLGQGIGMRDCVGRCCNTPLCDVAFMFSDKCYAVGCYNEDNCQAVLAKPSSLNPKLAYVPKNRGITELTPSLTDGIEFNVESDKLGNVCSAENVKHGPVYSNKTLLGGMKAGNFSYLGKASDINHCLSKCCSDGGCDVAYLVNKDQCFSVKCFTPELCQVTDKLFNNRHIEIAKLIKPKHQHGMSRGLLAAYFAVGLVCAVIGVAGFLWAALIFVKRNELKRKNMAKTNETEDDSMQVPRPNR